MSAIGISLVADCLESSSLLPDVVKRVGSLRFSAIRLVRYFEENMVRQVLRVDIEFLFVSSPAMTIPAAASVEVIAKKTKPLYRTSVA